mmetsp:Transcript_84527/g.262476  ORF Transcript_84527/g.262476 Transcript_84527/m.262476 type:complete len:471 (+) Transcript_84527:107-1519(+)
MSIIDHTVVFLLFVATCITGWIARPIAKEETTKAFRDYRFSFLLACGCLASAEAFTLPYGQALFHQFGWRTEEVQIMFGVAILPHLIVCFQVGAIADRYGRKQSCLLCCVLLMAMVVCSHIRAFWMMVTGIFLTNITSLTFTTAPESWLVHEHVVQRGLSGGLLGHMFACMFVTRSAALVATSYTASIVFGQNGGPIFEGSSIHVGGVHRLFDLGLLMSAVALGLIATRWNESTASLGKDAEGHVAYMLEAKKVILSDRRVALLGAGVACFAASRLIFMQHWFISLHVVSSEAGVMQDLSRTLRLHSVALMSGMLGAVLYSMVSARLPGSFRSSVHMLGGSFAVGCLAFAVAAATSRRGELGEMPSWACVVAVLVCKMFEGFAQPAAGVLKGEIIPDNVRTTLYVFFDWLGFLFASTQTAVMPGKALWHGALALLAAVAFFVSLGLHTAPIGEGEGKDVDTFYQQVAKQV